MKKIVILANSDMGLYKFRKELICELTTKYEVLISVPEGNYTDLLKKMGCKIYEIPISRRSLNPLKDLLLLFNYFKLLMKLKPYYVLTYTIKPNIYGGIICRLLGYKYMVNITGLGTALEKKCFFSNILFKLYSVSLKKAKVIFFQNKNNQQVINSKIKISAKQILLPGSGVNLQEYRYLDYPSDNENTKFLFIGRIMEAKGVNELLLGYKLLSEKYKNVNLTIIGSIEEGYNTDLLDSLIEKNIVDYKGEQKFVNEFINDSHVLINPSYHEGMSNVLLEAGASGRPLLASNVPGCREIVKDGSNGFLFEPKNYISLFETLEKFHLLDFSEKKHMGKLSNLFIKGKFDRNIIIGQYFNELEGEKNG